MLELRNVSLTIKKHGEQTDLLHEVSLLVPKQHFMAVVGPSGCGKTTLLKVIAGITDETSGDLLWEGRSLADDAELEMTDIGYVPQFSVAYEHLTVCENIESAARLRVRAATGRYLERLIRLILLRTGLEEIRDRKVKVLSGGQRRRLGLALELVNNPKLLLCDEVTSGLDPRSERDIVRLLHELSQTDDRIVVSVTHSLTNLELYDSVLVMHEGCVVYHGPPSALCHYFSVDTAEEIYPRLGKRKALRWHASWQKHSESYYRAFGIPVTSRVEPAGPVAQVATAGAEQAEPVTDINPVHTHRPTERQWVKEEAEKPEGEAVPLTSGLEGMDRHLPGMLTQFGVLLSRRLRLFLRDRTQLLLHFAILVGFPCLVVLFTPGLFEKGGMGIPPMPSQLSFSEATASPTALEKASEVIRTQVGIGGLISGIVMFQVILLTLMGSNNSAREVVVERAIFEKEKLAGLRPFSYLLSKLSFLGLICIFQSLWMSAFVGHFTGIPGSFLHQFSLLFLVVTAMTSICLAISSWMKSTEQASLLSIYLVGFQLPLSGAILALPEQVEQVIRPLIAAYWSWAGQLDLLRESTNYDVGIVKAASSSLADFELCTVVLAIHALVGIVFAYIGCKRHQWQ